MRIYNGKNSQVDLPLATQRISIPAHSVSKDFMPNNEFLSLLASSYDDKELALIVSGPYEINMCANIPAIVTLVVQSLDEAVARFNAPLPVEEKKEEEAMPLPEVPQQIVEEELIPEAVVEEEEPTPGDVDDETAEPGEEGPVLDEETEEAEAPAVAMPEVPQQGGKKKKNKKKNR